jgi:hypothetical protein
LEVKRAQDEQVMKKELVKESERKQKQELFASLAKEADAYTAEQMKKKQERI